MKILHISSANQFSGAGVAALNIQQQQLATGIDSKILFLKDDECEKSGIFSYVNSRPKRLHQMIVTFLDRIFLFLYPKRKNLAFSCSFFGLSLDNNRLFNEADIIHLHWINHGFLSIKQISEINKPIIWTMHDMWTFTGGCHSAYSCVRFTHQCGACPHLGSSNNKDLAYSIQKQKLKYLSKAPITYIAVSSWMKDLANSSKVLDQQVDYRIFSGINTNIFHRTDLVRKFKDELLPGIKDKIILVGANDIKNPAKGVKYLMEALKKLNTSCIVINFGDGTLTEEEIGKPVINLGFIADKRLLAKYYQIADLFVSTSEVEAFGMTLAEAQCCGTPVVAFRKGGPIDIIEDGKTGFLVPFPKVTEFVETLGRALDHDFDRDLICSRSIAKFSLAKTSLEYELIYKRVLNIY